MMKKKRVGKVSTKKLHDTNQLGIVHPQPKPVDMPISDYFKSVLHIMDPATGKTFGEAIIEKQCELAAMGSSKAAEFIFDRAYGKPQQSVSIQSTPPITIQHNVIDIDEAKQL